MTESIFDIALVGGGIVGLATAFQLQEHCPDYSVCVIEKEDQVATHQTGHNSGVIHSGIYYPPGSLKAKLCVEGRRKLIEFAEENHIPYELCGKVILAASAEEVHPLERLYERGVANGVSDLELIGSERIKELEPSASGKLGIYSPKTGIIHYPSVARTLARNILANGGKIYTGSALSKIEKRNAHFVLHTSKEVLQSRWLINCAGLFADKVAKMAGLKPKVRIIPFRGEYWFLRENKYRLVHNLIYPVPRPEMPFLGAHFTRTLEGRIETGPNAVLALGRETYGRGQVDLAESLDMFFDRRFWKMALQYWRTGIFELYHALRKASFVQSLQRLVSSIAEDDLVEGPTGIRAQCIDERGNLVNDFQVLEAPQSLHVLNVPSPAATACFAIAGYLVQLATSAFNLGSLKLRVS